MIEESMKTFLEGVVGIVEATRNEQHMLWEEWHEKRQWRSNLLGRMELVGHLANMPVCIALSTAIVDGSKLLFWHATSQVVDHRMIDKWLKDNLPNVKKTDATNFHIVLVTGELP